MKLDLGDLIYDWMVTHPRHVDLNLQKLSTNDMIRALLEKPEIINHYEDPDKHTMSGIQFADNSLEARDYGCSFIFGHGPKMGKRCNIGRNINTFHNNAPQRCRFHSAKVFFDYPWPDPNFPFNWTGSEREIVTSSGGKIEDFLTGVMHLDVSKFQQDDLNKLYEKCKESLEKLSSEVKNYIVEKYRIT